MKIFELTRIKLIIWYVLIIMTISMMFSFVIYKGVTKNIETSFRNAETRFENNAGTHALKKLADSRGISSKIAREDLHNLLLEELENSKHNVLLYLLITNIVIFLTSTLISYYLSGKTLSPIEQIVQEQKRFIADASHELKTPLTSLKTSIEVSIRSGKLPKDIEKLFQYNLEDVNALNELIDKLLNLSSLESKKFTFDNLDIKEIIQIAIKRVRYLSDEKKVEIKINTKNYQLMGNDASLTELFVILFDNAIKYGSKNAKVVVNVKQTKNCLIIEVKDMGIGINKKYLPNIFDRFYRIDSSRTCINRGRDTGAQVNNIKSGYGLGLSMAKKIVENHNGKISVSSELSKGTTFTIKLPREYKPHKTNFY